MALFDIDNQAAELAELAQLAADNKLLRSMAKQSKESMLDANQRMFNIIWMRPSTAAIQRFVDTFPAADQQEMFQRHAAFQAYLASQFTDFVPLVPPYEYSWSEEGKLVIGDKRDQPAT